MGWRSLVPIRAGQPVEVTMALGVQREARELAVVITGHPVKHGTQLTGTGFTWSDWLGAPYFYVPPGTAGTAVTFNMTFDSPVSELVVQVKRVRQRSEVEPGAVLDAMITCYDGDRLDIARSARMEPMGQTS